MRGLRTKESEDFINFFKIVQNEANKQYSVFFLDCGQGNEFVTETIDGENLSGWLIPNDKSDEFEKIWKSISGMNGLDDWLDFYKWAEWKKVGEKIEIEFVEYG